MGDQLVTVEGAKRLRSTLRKAGHDLSVMKEAHADAASIAAEAARARAPMGPTGRLIRSIRSSGTTTAGIVRSGYKSVPYAGPIHWGWAARSIKANEFMSDGATSSESRWLPVYEAGVQKALNQVQGK
ncbi:hypothetical protein ACFY5D_18120 [Paeniglutamicibacter sp. NPDC012692]|uniref:hypothetical protein n=1 Tax=Paeniglutamicibacter sp. NPDC012692 TaxID=3364388 RepID=UPI00368D6468